MAICGVRVVPIFPEALASVLSATAGSAMAARPGALEGLDWASAAGDRLSRVPGVASGLGAGLVRGRAAVLAFGVLRRTSSRSVCWLLCWAWC